MSEGIYFNAEVTLRRMEFSGVSSVESKIEENNRSIEDAKKRIQMFVSASPRDIIDPEWKEQPIDWLVNSTNEFFEVIENLTRENTFLLLYIDYLNNKNFN